MLLEWNVPLLTILFSIPFFFLIVRARCSEKGFSDLFLFLLGMGLLLPFLGLLLHDVSCCKVSGEGEAERGLR